MATFPSINFGSSDTEDEFIVGVSLFHGNNEDWAPIQLTNPIPADVSFGVFSASVADVTGLTDVAASVPAPDRVCPGAPVKASSDAVLDLSLCQSNRALCFPPGAPVKAPAPAKRRLAELEADSVYSVFQGHGRKKMRVFHMLDGSTVSIPAMATRGLEENPLPIVYDLSRPDVWSPEEHRNFSREFRRDVRGKLLACKAASRLRLPFVPLAILIDAMKLEDADDFAASDSEDYE